MVDIAIHRAAPPPPPATVLPLLTAAGPLAGVHALVVAKPGPVSLDLLCGLISRGCGAAAEAPPYGPTPVEPAEIVLVPQVDRIEVAVSAIQLARRCLLPCGRIVLQDTTANLAPAIAKLLRAAGFSFVRSRPVADVVVISADWPMFGHQLHETHHA